MEVCSPLRPAPFHGPCCRVLLPVHALPHTPTLHAFLVLLDVSPSNLQRVVAEVLGDPALEAEWRSECKAMADRIIAMRQALKDGLEAAGSTKDWSHVTSQIGSTASRSLIPPPLAN